MTAGDVLAVVAIEAVVAVVAAVVARLVVRRTMRGLVAEWTADAETWCDVTPPALVDPVLDGSPYEHLHELDGATFTVPVIDGEGMVGALHVDPDSGTSRRELLIDTPPEEHA